MQPAPGRRTAVRHQTLRRVKVIEDASAMLEEHCSVIGQTDTPSRSVEQPHPKLGLEARDTFANARWGYIQYASGLRKTARLRGADERENAAQAIHLLLFNCRQSVRSVMPAIRLIKAWGADHTSCRVEQQ